MIIPSIDLQSGCAVQLERGRELKLNAGDPRPIAAQFGLIGEVAVIDLDAALRRTPSQPGQPSQPDNEATIRDLLHLAPCRIGGGIRDYTAAARWLDAGAQRIILGTAAEPDLLRRLPRQRLIAALDAENGEVVIEGWRTRTGASIEDRMRDLAPFVGGFLITFVETEGTMQGLDIQRAAKLKQLAGDRQLTVAGGVATADEIGQLDRLGIDAQIGMALYTNRFSLADALAACLTSDRPDGLWPTIIVDELGAALGLAWSNRDSLTAAISSRAGIYRSRRRGTWRKGETSGDTQQLIAIALDCDRDALRFTVRQSRGFCHNQTRTCWGEDGGIGALSRRLAALRESPTEGSYTARLMGDQALLAAKLQEEAGELASAFGRTDVIHEAADVLYFTLAKLAASGVELADVQRALDRRALAITRRAGDAKLLANPAPPATVRATP